MFVPDSRGNLNKLRSVNTDIVQALANLLVSTQLLLRKHYTVRFRTVYGPSHAQRGIRPGIYAGFEKRGSLYYQSGLPDFP